MMTLIKDINLNSRVENLLAYATTFTKIESEYESYLSDDSRLLYGYEVEGELVGVVGIQLTNPHAATIRQIAVAPDYRGDGIGKHMIRYLAKWHELTSIMAETDVEAVDFYRTIGFSVESLGEKYPGCERFNCEFDITKR